MTPERWEAIGTLFEQALAVPAAERTALIDLVSGRDPEVRREVLSLLASHDAAPGGFVQKRIEVALVSFHRASNASTPARVGPYRLVREIGRGGMGAVFLAQRDDETYQAQVAIKLVRPGMDTEFILARFRRERQTLARLQHPNICRLLDGGTTDSGLPYFVMEYIDGPWVTTYAAEHKLGIDARLRLFLEICSAVDYAHRNFIVHRDLKPGNILVDAAGAPRLLDFGICKLLAETAHDTTVTALTPTYASPEQIRGSGATISSDVYSLGAVLYELLTSTCPRRFDKLTPSAIERALEAPIVRPSAAVRDLRLARRLAGDVDNVLMCALDAEPERRYDSVAHFADDVRRHLEHEPVRARPQTLGYRATTFLRRYRGATVAVASVIAALLIGAIVSLREARLADARLGQIRSLAATLVFDVHDSVRDLPGSTQARQMIVQTGLRYLDELAKSAGHDPRAAKEMAGAYRRLGDVQANAESANAADLRGALAQYEKALPLLEDAIRNRSTDVDVRTEQLVLYNRIATIQAGTGKLREAQQTFQEAIERASIPAGSSDRQFRLALADAYLGSSNALRNLGDDRGAVAAAAEGLRLYREAAAADRSNPGVMRGLASAHAAVGMGEMRLGRLEPALASFREGTTTLETLVASEPRNVTWNRELMVAYGHIADALGNPDLPNLGDSAGALGAYRQAAQIGKRLYEGDRSDQRAASDYGTVLLHLGAALTAAGKLEDARLVYVESAAIAEPSLKLGHAPLFVVFILANQRLALNAVARARRADALSFAERAFQAGEHPPADAVLLRAGPRGRSAMGLTYAALLQSPVRRPTDRDAALAWLRKAADAWRAARTDPAFAALHQREMREVEDALGRLERR